MAIIVTGEITTAIKKLFKGKARVERPDSAADLIQLDPAISDVAGIVFSPEVLAGRSGEALMGALERRHPNVVAIIVYKDPRIFEKVDFERIPDLYPIQLSKFIGTPELEASVTGAINSAIRRGQTDIPDSSVAVESEIGSSYDVFSSPSDEEGDADEILDGGDPPDTEAAKQPLTGDLTPVPEPSEPEAPSAESVPPGEPGNDLLTRVGEAAKNLDIEAVSALLKGNNITRQLMLENSAYNAAMTAVTTLSREISLIYLDPGKPQEEKLDRMRELILETSKFKGAANALLADKFIEILELVSASVKEYTEKELAGVKRRFSDLNMSGIYLSEAGKLKGLIRERYETQAKLRTILSKLIHTYSVLDFNRDEMISQLKDQPLHENGIVSEVFAPIKEALSPINTAELVNSLIRAVEEKRITFSAISDDIGEAVEMMFRLYDFDQQTIEDTVRLNGFLAANSVTQYVVAENILQQKVRIFIGPDDSGRSVTSLAAATAVSMAETVLLLDLSSRSKISRYLASALSLTEFYDRLPRGRLIIAAKGDGEDVDFMRLAESLKNCVNVFSRVYITVSVGDLELFDDLLPMASVVNFISDGRMDSLDKLRPVTNAFNQFNKAQILTLVNSGTDPVKVIEYLGMDLARTKLIRIPFFPEIQDAALFKANPGEYPRIRDLFLEAYV
jgi:hypothetical protein